MERRFGVGLFGTVGREKRLHSVIVRYHQKSQRAVFLRIVPKVIVWLECMLESCAALVVLENGRVITRRANVPGIGRGSRRRDPHRSATPSGPADGSEFRRPLGISIVGGLAVSQLLTLYTTPVVYLYLDRFRLWCRRLRVGRGEWPSLEGR